MTTQKVSVGDTIKLTGEVVDMDLARGSSGMTAIRFSETEGPCWMYNQRLQNAEIIPRPLSIPGEVVEAIKEWWAGTKEHNPDKKEFKEWLESHRAKD